MIRKGIYEKRVLEIAVGITVIVLLLVGGVIAARESSVDYNRSEQSINSTIFDTDEVNISINQTQADSDGDGISDNDEINGFVWNNITYYTDPLQKSTDFDPYNDYKEITTINMDPTVLSPGRHPLVPSYPDLKVEIGKIAVNTLTKITSTETKESYSTWNINTLTVDVTKENWGANTEAKVGFSGWSFSPYGEVKASAYYDYFHLLTTISTGTTSGWNKEAWSMATAIDTDKAARLKYYLKIRNNGTDTAKNVQLKFNVKIGNKIITTITTDKVANRIDPNTVYPVDTFFVIEKDHFGNDITVTLNELKSIELGVPLTIEILEIYAEVPWENEQYKDWSDYKASIDRTSARIVLDTGSGVKEYRVFSGIRYPASGNPYYFMNVTLENATLYTLGGEQKEDGIYIGGEKVEDWRFGFDNSTFTEVVKHLNKTNGSLLSIPIRQGWTVLMKPPDKEPPKIHWAVYTKDMKGIVASVSDNEKVGNVTAYIKVGSAYQTVILKDDNNDLIFNATLPEKITDLCGGFITVDDGKLVSTFRISIIPNILVDDDLKDDPANHTWNTIQEGIDNANESDVVYVRNGVYKEKIAIYKPLTLMGEDNNNTIIDDSGEVVYVNANNVQICGFKVINEKSEYSASSEIEIRGEVANGSFTWTPDNFGRFWYDIENDAGNETLKAVVNGRSIYANNLFYTTTPMEVRFKHLYFGKYESIGFMGEKYFSGYTINSSLSSNKKISTLVRNQLHKVLLDDDDKYAIPIGDIINLEEGYAIKVKDVDVRGREVWLSLLKDGNEIDSAVVSAGQVYTYAPSKVGAISNLPIIGVHIGSIFIGQDEKVVFLKGIFQISEYYTIVHAGNHYGKMEITAVSSNGITMENYWSLTLTKDSSIDIMGNLKFKVADSEILRYYPFVNRYNYQDSNTVEIRGKVAKGIKPQSWDAYSFSGLYYDLNQDLKPEKMDILGISGRTIKEGNLTYETHRVPKYFNIYKYLRILINGRQNYSVIGLGGEQYTAINGNATKLSRLIKEHGASSAEKKTLTIGETWEVGEGWKLTAISIDANSSPRWARFVLSLNGVNKSDRVLQQGEVFVYNENFAGETDVPLFITYLDSIFKGATTNMVQLRYTWTISPEVMFIENGDEFGKLKVVNANQDKLILKNNFGFSLDSGRIINIIKNINFRVSDSTDIRYYPVKIITPRTGIKLYKSGNNIITGINIINSSIGISIYSAKGISLEKNSISSDYIGIYLIDSFQNVLKNTTIIAQYGIKPEGHTRIHFNNSIDTSNQFNGKPIYYYFNRNNIILSRIDTNHLTLANSTGVNIENSIIGGDGINLYYSDSNTFKYNTFDTSGGGYIVGLSINLYRSLYNDIVGNNLNIALTESSNNVMRDNNASIYLYFSDNNLLTNNRANSNSENGILLSSSNSNIISDNKANSNFNMGIALVSSRNNTLNGNDASYNRYSGMTIYDSINNTLIGNNASNNYYGVSVYSSGGNTFYQNELINNSFYNAYDNGMNQWDNGIIGNHYSNFDESYEGCTDSDFNNICDSKFDIPGGLSVDRYPIKRIYECLENYSNIEVKERYDLHIFKDKVTSYAFRSGSNPILFVNITGNVNAGEITTAVEVLRNTSTCLQEPALGTVYKNVNIWVGPYGFAVPKNIKEAIIVFKVENSWLMSGRLKNTEIKILRWDGTRWLSLDTELKNNDGNFTYFESKTTAFSPFVITGQKVESLTIMNTSSIVTNRTAIITWVTNTPSNSMIKYGITPGNYTSTKYINESVIFHNITISDLSPDTNYYFVINSSYNVGSTQSEERTFWTPYDSFQDLNISNIEIKQLTEYEELASSPVWIENKIFYASNISGNMDVWVMDQDGTNKTSITNSTSDEYPSDSWISWENNSKIYKVIYVSGRSNIWIMNGDGTNKTQLTNDSYENFDPTLVYVPLPVIFGMQPSDTINNNLPLINASYYSYYGNINRVNISVDGIDVTLYADISTSNLSYIPAEPLKLGPHNFTVTLETDKYTRITRYQFFNIRFIYNPSPSCTIFTNTPTISANISVGYGNISSVIMTLDGINVTSNATIYPSYIEYTPIVPLINGSHSVWLEVKSSKNFSDTENWIFSVNFPLPCTTTGGSGSGGGGSPKIMFSSNRSGNLDLWLMNLDGTGLQQMTFETSNESSPAWVESKVVYISDKSGNNDIWSMDANGSNKKQLTTSVLNENMLSWSYIGGIIYTTGKNGISNLEAMNIETTGKLKITNSATLVDEPRLSPENKGILYSSSAKGKSSIFLMNFKENGPKVKFWELEEGYILQVLSIDIKSAQAWLKLQKNGSSKEDHIVRIGEAFSMMDKHRTVLTGILNRISSSDYYFEVELVNVTQFSSIDGKPLFANTTKILVNKILLYGSMDTNSPDSVTNLTNISYAPTYINWTWIDPEDSDFDKIMVYINGIRQPDVLKGYQFFNATGLNPNTLYEIGTHTVDNSGNVNQTWVNHTARTAELESPIISFDVQKVNITVNSLFTLNLTLDSAPAGLSGYNLTISLSNTSVAELISVEFPTWASLKSNSSFPGGSVWIKAADINELISSSANNVLLATLTIRGDAPGNANLLISVSSMDDDNGTQINPATVASQVEVSAVVPFLCEVCKVPTDPDGDGLYEDINGNGRKDFNDVVVFFNYLEWVASNEPISNFDFNGNGRIDFNDIVKLFEEL